MLSANKGKEGLEWPCEKPRRVVQAGGVRR